MEISRTEYAAAVEAVLANTVAEIVRIVTPTADLISPRARERRNLARGTKTTFKVVLTFNGHNLTDLDEGYEYGFESPVRKAAETYKLTKAAQALRTALLDQYWQIVDGQDGVLTKIGAL